MRKLLEVSGRRLGLAILGNGVMTVLAQGAGILFTFIGAKIFAQDVFGLLLMGVGMLMFASTLAGMGFPGSIPHFMTVGLVRQDKLFLNQIMRTGTIVVIFTGVIIGGLLYVFASPIADRLYNKPAVASIFTWAAFGVPFLAFSKVMTSALRGMDRVVLATFIDLVLWRVLHLSVLLGAILFGYGVEGTILGIAVTPLIMVALGLNYTWSFMGKATGLGRPSMSRETLTYTANSWITSIAMLLRNRGDVVLLGFFLSSSQIAAFAVGGTLAAIPLTFVNIIGPAYRPVATRLLQEKRVSELLGYHARIVRLNLVVIAPVAIFLFLFAEPIMTTLFGQVYQNSALVLQILLIGALLQAVMGPVNPTLLALGLAGPVRRIDVSSSVLFIVFIIVLAPLLGLPGAALALGGTKLFQHALKNLEVRRHLSIPWIPNPGVLPFFALILLIGGILRFLELVMLPEATGWLVVFMPFLSFAFASAFLTKQISLTDLSQVFSLLHGWRSPVTNTSKQA